MESFFVEPIDIACNKSGVFNDTRRRRAGDLEGTHAILVDFLLEALLFDRFGNEIDGLPKYGLKALAQFFKPADVVKAAGHARLPM